LCGAPSHRGQVLWRLSTLKSSTQLRVGVTVL
jgi:hypothetical protein